MLTFDCHYFETHFKFLGVHQNQRSLNHSSFQARKKREKNQERRTPRKRKEIRKKRRIKRERLN